MYDTIIQEQIAVLVKAKLISKDDENTAGQLLRKKYWHDKIALVWSAEDVTEHAKNSSIDLTEDEAIEILGSVHHHHDCQYGVTWETLQYYIDEVMHADVLQVKNAKKKELPLLIGKLRTEKAQKMLERRMRGVKNWEEEPKE